LVQLSVGQLRASVINAQVHVQKKWKARIRAQFVDKKGFSARDGISKQVVQFRLVLDVELSARKAIKANVGRRQVSVLLA
jgi:hypothetical protein